jgi:hypothetical protein
MAETRVLETECGLGRTREIHLSPAWERMTLSYSTKMFRNERSEKIILYVINGRVKNTH